MPHKKNNQLSKFPFNTSATFFAWQYCEIHRETTTCYYFVDHIMEVWGQLSEVWNSEASQGNPDSSAVSLLLNFPNNSNIAKSQTKYPYF